MMAMFHHEKRSLFLSDTTNAPSDESRGNSHHTSQICCLGPEFIDCSSSSKHTNEKIERAATEEKVSKDENGEEWRLKSMLNPTELSVVQALLDLSTTAHIPTTRLLPSPSQSSSKSDPYFRGSEVLADDEILSIHIHTHPSMLADATATAAYYVTSDSLTSSSSSSSSLSCEESSDEDASTSASMVSVSQANNNLLFNDSSNNDNAPACVIRRKENSISLSLDADEDFLSPLHCFMRKYCVEAFCATSDDAEDSHPPHVGRGVGVSVGQVGIRCLHCKHRPVHQRAERAVCYPSSLKNIYHSIETWQRRHSLVCSDLPLWIVHEMTRLMHASKQKGGGAGGRRGYWQESALRIGLVDDPYYGIIRWTGGEGGGSGYGSSNTIIPTDRFVGARTSTYQPHIMDVIYNSNHVNADSLVQKENLSITNTSTKKTRGLPVVAPEDQFSVTEYLFLLLDQMETCSFTEEDRAGGRSKIKDCPVGFPGMQCKHCGGKAGFGRYFPATVSALTSANSDRNIYNHIQKCRRCPAVIQRNLELLHRRGEDQSIHHHHHHQQQRYKNRRGSRKELFQRVWERLHSNDAPRLEH